MYHSTYTETSFCKQQQNTLKYCDTQHLLFIKVIYPTPFPSKCGKWQFWATSMPVFSPSLWLCTTYTNSPLCNLPGASRWSPVLQQVARLKMGEEIMNETQLKVSRYTLVPGNGCWRRQFRNFQEQSNTGKADVLDLLRAETSSYIITNNCTKIHEMLTTSKHFSRALPFLIIISCLREHWVFTAKNVHSLLEWTWPSPSLDCFYTSIIQFNIVLLQISIFFFFFQDHSVLKRL